MLEYKYEAGSVDWTFYFHEDNNRVNKSDIRDYEWEYEEQYSKIRQFSKPLSTRTIPVVFFQRMNGETGEMYSVPQNMYEVFDRDVRELKMGKFYIGEYWVDCYVIGSKKAAYDNGKIIKLELTILSDFTWHKTDYMEFNTQPSGGGGEPSEYLDFQYDFEYDYYGGSERGMSQFASEAIAPFKFRLEFEGPIEDPFFQIGDNTYRVFTSIPAGQKLVIDSREKRVYRVTAVGEEISEFNNRDRDHYIFQPMPIDEGKTEVVYPECKTALWGYVERSEPTWT